MQAAQRAIWLLSGTTKNDYISLIETKMSALACYVYLRNEQFQSMIRELCEQYMARSMYREAVAWFQWMAHDNDIYLGPPKSSSSTDDLLVRFNFLDQWLGAYLTLVETDRDHGTINTVAYMTVAGKLLSQLGAIPKKWSASPAPQILEELG